MEGWRQLLEVLNEDQRELVLGSSLSARFASWPLAISHPAIVGAFYAMLLTAALILPLGYHNNWDFGAWLSEVSVRGLSMALGLAIAGQFSSIISKFFERPPITPPRKVIYSMAFIGFAMLLANWMDLTPQIPEQIAWVLMIAPGPIYVHLSWAPRHRMLVMLEDGKDPFGPPVLELGNLQMERELEEAVESLDL